jgi:hypothetical protein
VDDKNLRQTMSASSMGANPLASPNQCTLGASAGPIVVRQVVGEMMQQKVLDVSVAVPDPNPGIEQIIDVFVKNVEINSVDVITDKVVVRGDLEIKAIYVACTPGNAVHAVELKGVRWTQDLPIAGARRGMDAEASVVVEFVDYDVPPMSRAYRHKYGMGMGMGMGHYDDMDDDESCGQCEQPPPPPLAEAVQPTCELPAAEVPVPEVPVECGLREFAVSIILRVSAKVLTDRMVQLGGAAVPPSPKG